MPRFPAAGNGPRKSFSIKNDRILTNLRVTNPNTLKVPSAGLQLINPNIPDSGVTRPEFPADFHGSNDPATNPT